jgi:alanine racemase
VLAVIKSNGYGHGLLEIAEILADADGFGVARLEAAAQLRKAGISKPVVVLGGVIDRAELEAALQLRVDVVVHAPEHVDLIENLQRGAELGVWLKIDTGMGRLGVDPVLLPVLVNRLQACPAVRVPLRLMTHLAGADCPGDPATAEQIRCFGRAIGTWTGDVSIANSAGIVAWPESLAPSDQLRYRGDNWVRPGLVLYGPSPIPGQAAASFGLQPAMSFETRLVSIRQVSAGTRVGYAGAWRAARDSLIGVASAGYGDGYPWGLPSGTPVCVNGVRVPLAGRVSMDLITIDLTDLLTAEIGDRVVLWGDEPTVDEIATAAGTIPYELLTGISQRVSRSVAS